MRTVIFAFVILAASHASARPGTIAGEAIGDRVTRYFADEAARASAPPSLALQRPFPAVGPAPALPAVALEFQAVPADGGSHSPARSRLVLSVEAGTSLYGTGEVTGPLLRNGRRVVCWNTDAYGYGDSAMSLYKAHPWVLGVRADGTAFGVLADTTYRCEIDLTSVGAGGGWGSFTSDGPPFPVIVIDRDHPAQVVAALADLTGKISLPPRWALGYHQCRYSYFPEARVQEIARGFRSRSIPCDVIWHDIDYMRGFRCFTFDPAHFPDPRRHNDALHALGFHTVWMIDPGIKAEPGYPVFDSGTAQDVWVKRADGTTTYQGEVWPGMCVFPDFTREATRVWWAGLYRDFMATGVDGVWNDMNEPAVFNVKSKTMPEDNVHRADASIGGTGPHARYHNVYGTLMVQATREGILEANPDRRPFVLSRASFIGGHRFGASWTGDNSAEWYHLESSIPMVLNLGLSGQPFTGPDIGGFAGNGPAGGEGKLFARWMGIGSLLPFARGHTGKGNIDKEPWAFGPEVEATCRRALNRRYILMPYLYTLFHDAALTGVPVARPLFFADPRDPALRTEDDAFLLGGDLCVTADVVPDRSRVPVLPRGAWRELRFEGEEPDEDLPRVTVRPGAIVPLGPVTQYVDEKPLDPLTLVVNLDDAGVAAGSLYEDAGDGFGYERGDLLLTRYEATTAAGAVTVRVFSSEGKRVRPSRPVRVTVLTDTGIASGAGTDGSPVEVRLK